jgi:hypothetical protein
VTSALLVKGGDGTIRGGIAPPQVTAGEVVVEL